MSYQVRKFVETPRNLAALVFVVGAVGTVIATRVPNPYTLTLPALLVVGAVLAVAVGNRTATLPRSAILSPELFGSVYMLTLTATVGAFVLSGYVRTFPVHLLTVGLYVLAGLSVLTLGSTRKQLGLVLLTGLFHRGTIYYASASQLGIDALLHNRWAAEIASTGTLAPLAAAETKYWYAPLYHVWTAGLTSALGISARDAAFIGVSAVVLLVPALVVYDLLGRAWSPEMGVIGSLLFVASDRPIALAAHTVTTSVGLVLFAVILYSTVRYLDSDEGSYQMAFVIGLTGLVLTHQLSLFITAVTVTSYLVFRSLWEGSLELRRIRLIAILGFAGMAQSLVTKDPGSSGTSESFFSVVLGNVMSAFEQGERAASVLPQSADYVITGSDSLSVLHVLGLGILFCLAIVGVVSWVRRSSEDGIRLAMAFGGVVVVINFFVFILPLIGISALLPYRWFSFMYVPLVMLAAPGLVALVSTVARGHRPGQWYALRAVLVVVVVVAPFSALMAWNYPGAADGPVMDDANGAFRISTTDGEVAAMDHTARYAGETPVYADWFISLYLERYFERPSGPYQVQYGERPATWDEPALFVDRPYAHTKHAGYMINYDGKWYTVYGAIPPTNPRASTVYTNGDVELTYGRQVIVSQD
ncbi:hypothetical protein ACFO0N_07525 [Halobium salinum]|uniref:Dolichyl-phosphate-mannose-protein mannosyltransferase n=1 Tax=Halobium salinum TaxID=1364940 RepID=A0ABD5PAG3_9EURY|nr:hypothetical protein [Halobium salinum]